MQNRSGIQVDLELRDDGNLWECSSFGEFIYGPVDEAVADALDVLRAVGWTTGIDQIRESGNAFAPVEASTWARSPWREVSGDV